MVITLIECDKQHVADHDSCHDELLIAVMTARPNNHDRHDVDHDDDYRAGDNDPSTGYLSCRTA